MRIAMSKEEMNGFVFDEVLLGFVADQFLFLRLRGFHFPRVNMKLNKTSLDTVPSCSTRRSRKS